MIFGDMEDGHDRRISKLLESDDNDVVSDEKITNFNLVGIRRRLNNIEMGVWLIAIVLAIDLFRNW